MRESFRHDPERSSVPHCIYHVQPTQGRNNCCGDDELTLVGGGRCDSPGFSARFSTYPLMEEHTGAILTFKVTHVAKSASSPSMEPDGCDCAIFLRSSCLWGQHRCDWH